MVLRVGSTVAWIGVPRTFLPYGSIGVVEARCESPWPWLVRWRPEFTYKAEARELLSICGNCHKPFEAHTKAKRCLFGASSWR